MRLVLVLFASVLLSACAVSPAPTSTEIEMGPGASLTVLPLEGPAKPLARMVSQTMADALSAYDIPAQMADDGRGGYQLVGRAEANNTDARVPYIILIHWQLIAPDGALLGKHTQGVNASWRQWEYGDPRMVRGVAKASAAAIAALLPRERRVPMPSDPLRAGLLVTPVSGAPGDGNVQLTDLIMAALRAVDVSITGDPRQAAFQLSGKVAIGAAVKGRQSVRVVWTVRTLDGSLIGRATQQNQVVAGSLDGRWKETAAIISANAVDGIEQIFKKAGIDTSGRPAYRPSVAR